MKIPKDKIKEKYRNFRQFLRENPRAVLKFEIGFLIGLITWVLLNSLLGISAFLISIPFAILIVLFLLALKVLGLEELGLEFWEKMLSIVGDMNTSEDTLDLLPPLVEFFPSIIELSTELSKALTHLGKAIFENFSILFPVLLDIQIDIDWLHISFAFLVRTFFNIVQFAVCFYIYRKIKHKIKRKISEQVEELKSSQI